MFPCDDPSFVGPYLPSYPTLQPTRPLGMQPAPAREEMVYPVTSAIIKYDGIDDTTHSGSILEIQGQSCLVDSPLQTGALPAPYAVVGGESSTYDGHSGFMGLNSRFHQMQGVESKPGADSFGGGEGVPHRNMPAKRGPFRDQDQREKTAVTRKMGSCIRCRMQRIRVCIFCPHMARIKTKKLTFFYSVTLTRRIKQGRVCRARRSPPVPGCID